MDRDAAELTVRRYLTEVRTRRDIGLQCYGIVRRVRIRLIARDRRTDFEWAGRRYPLYHLPTPLPAGQRRRGAC